MDGTVHIDASDDEIAVPPAVAEVYAKGLTEAAVMEKGSIDSSKIVGICRSKITPSEAHTYRQQ